MTFLGIKYEPLLDPPPPPVIKICEWGPWVFKLYLAVILLLYPPQPLFQLFPFRILAPINFVETLVSKICMSVCLGGGIQISFIQFSGPGNLAYRSTVHVHKPLPGTAEQLWDWGGGTISNSILGGTRHFFLLILYNCKNIRGHVLPPPPNPAFPLLHGPCLHENLFVSENSKNFTVIHDILHTIIYTCNNMVNSSYDYFVFTFKHRVLRLFRNK